MLNRPAISKRVLYVDADRDSLEMMVALLRLSGIHVRVADSVASGLSMGLQHEFDLMIVSEWYSDGDGFALCRRVSTQRPSLPILFYSGLAYPADVERGLDAGARDYIVKPGIDGLERAVIYWLQEDRFGARRA
jgi:DNA-binding response OmpR family regulator